MAMETAELLDALQRLTVALAIVRSEEALARSVTAAYQFLLGREPDAVGQAHWLSRLEGDLSATAFLAKNGDRFFIFNEKGELIVAKLSPKGYEEVSRAKIVEPTGTAFGRDVVWSHPAYAQKCAFIRNDKEIVCVDLSAPQ